MRRIKYLVRQEGGKQVRGLAAESIRRGGVGYYLVWGANALRSANALRIARNKGLDACPAEDRGCTGEQGSCDAGRDKNMGSEDGSLESESDDDQPLSDLIHSSNVEANSSGSDADDSSSDSDEGESEDEDSDSDESEWDSAVQYLMEQLDENGEIEINSYGPVYLYHSGVKGRAQFFASMRHGATCHVGAGRADMALRAMSRQDAHDLAQLDVLIAEADTAIQATAKEQQPLRDIQQWQRSARLELVDQRHKLDHPNARSLDETRAADRERGQRHRDRMYKLKHPRSQSRDQARAKDRARGQRKISRRWVRPR